MFHSAKPNQNGRYLIRIRIKKTLLDSSFFFINHELLFRINTSIVLAVESFSALKPKIMQNVH